MPLLIMFRTNLIKMTLQMKLKLKFLLKYHFIWKCQLRINTNLLKFDNWDPLKAYNITLFGSTMKFLKFQPFILNK